MWVAKICQPNVLLVGLQKNKKVEKSLMASKRFKEENPEVKNNEGHKSQTYVSPPALLRLKAALKYKRFTIIFY